MPDYAEDLIEELRGYARSHAAMKAGMGNTNDLLAFARWLESRLHELRQPRPRVPGKRRDAPAPTQPPQSSPT